MTPTPQQRTGNSGCDAQISRLTSHGLAGISHLKSQIYCLISIISYLISIISILIPTIPASAQAMLERQVIASASIGGSIGGASVQSTLGEAVVNTFADGETILSQGFHQPIILLAALKPVDSDLISGIVIYPNPASVEARLEFDLLENSKVEVFLINNAGQMVGNLQLQGIKGRIKHLIPLGGRYAAGLYYVVLKIEHEAHTEKLVIQ